ncbi:hypothetical protein ACWC98_11295 [Streptomyces goshikiensis]
MPHHDPDELDSYAVILTHLLPGTWTRELRQHDIHADQHVLTASVWDMNQVAEALAARPLEHDVILTRDDGRRLFLMDHPRYEDEFLIAVMAPVGVHAEAFRGVREPDGIAIPGDPERAAEAVITDLLPRYETALAQVNANTARLTSAASRPDTLVMTWTESGDLSVSTDHGEVAEILTGNGFVPDTDRHTYLLSGDDTAHQAQCVRAVGIALGVIHVGVSLQSAPHRSAPTTTRVPAPRPPAPNALRSR